MFRITSGGDKSFSENCCVSVYIDQFLESPKSHYTMCASDFCYVSLYSLYYHNRKKKVQNVKNSYFGVQSKFAIVDLLKMC